MAKDLEGTTPKLPKGSGETGATGGFKNRGKGLVTRSAGFSGTSDGMFTKGGKGKTAGKKTFG